MIAINKSLPPYAYGQSFPPNRVGGIYPNLFMVIYKTIKCSKSHY